MKQARVAAFLLLASSLSVTSATAAPRKADAGSWLWGLLGLQEQSRTGIAARNRDYVPQPKPSTKSQPVYDGLGAGTDHGEYVSAPQPQKDQR